jgi:hypothetical protein
VEGPSLKLEDVESPCTVLHAGRWHLEPYTEIGYSGGPRNSNRGGLQLSVGPALVRDRETGKAIEPELEKPIMIIEYPARNEHGPLWVRGGIPVESADGKQYTLRNRVTLCRCGKSGNKPFRDGSHVEH